jgi:hydroxyacylglutathione hydrolase
MLEIIRIHALKDNYIWLIYQPKTQCGVIVDPGEASPVLDILNSQAIQLSAIFLTHHHRDHCDGVVELLEHFNIPVYGPKKENILLCSHPLQENDAIFIKSLDATFHILDVPGHTLGHIAYFNENYLFCGDTLFTGGCGRLFEGTAEQMLSSLKKLKNLPAHILVYCGHEYTLANLEFAITLEPQNQALVARLTSTKRKRAQNEATVPSTLALELETNPFLRTNVPTIIEVVNRLGPKKQLQESEIFSWIRDRKNQLIL